MEILISLSKVPLKLVRPYAKKWDRTRYADIFNKYGAGKGKDKYRIYIPLGSSHSISDKDVSVPEAITDFLDARNMQLESWILGTVLMPDRKRTTRLGKVLKDHPALRAMFENAPDRQVAKTGGSLYAVISRHPYDIIGMSFDRGWTSCMNLTDGGNARYLKYDIAHGTLVAYLIRDDDKNINKPIARSAIKPLIKEQGKKEMILRAGKIYGTSIPGFVAAVEKFCRWANSGASSGRFKLSSELYNDFSGGGSLYHVADNSPMPKDVRIRTEIARQSSTEISILARLTEDKSAKVRYAVARNESTPVDLLEKLSYDIDSEVRYGVATNTNTPTNVLVRLVEDKDIEVRKAALNKELPKEVWLKVAEDQALQEHLTGKLHLIPRSVYEQVVLKLVAGSPEVQRRLASKDIPDNVLMMLARSPDPHIRLQVLRNPATTDEVLIALAEKPEARMWADIADKAEDPAVLDAILNNTAPEAKRALTYSVAHRIIHSDYITPEQLHRVFTRWSNNYEILATLATRHDLPKELRAKLLEIDNEDVQVGVVRGISDSATLVKLAKSKYHPVRAAVAERVHMSQKAGEILASDPDVRIRTILANDTYLSGKAVITLLENSPEENVRIRVLDSGYKLPRAWYEKLLQEPGEDNEVKRAVLRSEHVPTDLLTAHIADPDTKIRYAIASRILPKAVSYKMAEAETDVTVLRRLVRNLNHADRVALASVIIPKIQDFYTRPIEADAAIGILNQYDGQPISAKFPKALRDEAIRKLESIDDRYPDSDWA